MKNYGCRFNKPSVYDRAFFLSKWFFGYTLPIFYKGHKNNVLESDDIPGCSERDRAELLFARLAKYWNQELRCRREAKFSRALFKTFATSYIVPFLIYFLEECVFRIIQIILLSRIIRYFSKEDSSITYEQACWYAAGVTISSTIMVTIHHPVMFNLRRLGLNIRTACTSLMYKKILQLNNASLNQTDVGQIINIMSNDLYRLDDFSYYLTYLFVSPIQMFIVIYIIYQYYGWACFVGVAILLLFIPFQIFMGKMFTMMRLKTANLTDIRLRYLNEIISGIRVIKMYAWESSFAKRISDARRKEVNKIRRICFLKALNLSIFFVATKIIFFVCFITYLLSHGKISSEGVFVGMALFNTLRLTMTFFFPMTIAYGSELLVTFKRLENFLLLDEMQHSKKNSITPTIQMSPKLIVENFCAKWDPTLEQPTLNCNIRFELKPGDLLAVIGPVGAGKSSFLMAILRELSLTSGEIHVEGKLSYASQDPWSFNESVRNNILFGMEYDEKKYNEIIKVCALERDLTLMPFGDRTLVGEKGVSLSGGQKARINLARAIYRESDIYLLDDPLSAVDTAVAKHIFNKCIVEHLQDKIRVLVTHQTQFIQHCTKILILHSDGSMTFGTYEQLQQQQMDIEFISKLLMPEQEQQKTTNNSEEPEKLLEIQPKEEESTKMDEEHFQKGSIKWKVYYEYLKAGAGPISLTIQILFTLISQTIFHGSDLFLMFWTNQIHINGKVPSEQHNNIIIYSGSILALFLTTGIRSVSFFLICMRSSINLHNQIFSRLLNTKISWFNRNPAGRVLNRFSRDLGIMDEMLPVIGYDINLTWGQAIGVIITVSIISWYLIFPAIVLTLITFYLRAIYIKSARDIKRFENMARSPVYSHVSTTLNGMASIRAFQAEKAFVHKFYSYQNDHSASWFMFISSSQCLSFIIEWVSVLYIGCISLAVILSRDMSGGSAGLALASGLLLGGMTQWGVRQSAELESYMTSVERIIEYQNLPMEPIRKCDFQPTPLWPEDGKIQFKQLCMKYDGSNKVVLKNIDCTIYPREKIGIVGRTGAGKSSLIAALFRLTEPCSGQIIIDNIDTKTLPLEYFRKRISIIPQDPVVFTGNVRYNLDPFQEHTDEEIWSALEDVQLKPLFMDNAEKLETSIIEGGSNLSVGQRQLICLARAILKNNKILILDEATANVDHQTDSLIQKTIREKFKECTVLTIAHRLNTIIDSNRVMIMDDGQIVEFENPYHLLKKSNGKFYEMCKKTGESMFNKLFIDSKEAYMK